MQVAELVTVPGGSWGRDHVLLKLSGVRVQVTRLVTAHGGRNGGYGGGCPPACRLAQVCEALENNCQILLNNG